MTLIIDKSNQKKLSELLRKKFQNKSKKGNLYKHFGNLKRNLDGLAYQNSARINED